jgi:hypothetical protein
MVNQTRQPGVSALFQEYRALAFRLNSSLRIAPAGLQCRETRGKRRCLWRVRLQCGPDRKKETATMIQRILDECSRRGTCPLNRKEFDETFAGSDLTIQIRAAIDFAQQNDLAFARSMGDQAFLFSRLAKASKARQKQPVNARSQPHHSTPRRFRSNRNGKGSFHPPAGRSF